MPATNQKRQLTVYLSIGLALLLGAFAADYFVPGLDVFKSKNAFYQNAGKQANSSGDVGERVVIDAPPQPRPIANRPRDNSDESKSDSIKHNHRLLPQQNRRARLGDEDVFHHISAYSSDSRMGQGVYAAQFRIAQNQDVPASAKGAPQQPRDRGNGRNNAKKSDNEDKPAYFDAPTVQPSEQPTTQATRGTSATGKSGLVVVRNKETERKLESRLQAGKRALRMNRYDAALSFFDELYKDYEDEPRVLMGRAIALQRLGRNQAAKNAYKALLKNDPDNIHAKINMYGIIQKNKPGLALRELKVLREEHPEHAGLAAQIGLISADIGKYDQASKYLQIAASIAPNNPRHYYNLGIVEEHKGNRERAIKYYEKAADQIAVSGQSTSLSKEKIYDRLAKLRKS